MADQAETTAATGTRPSGEGPGATFVPTPAIVVLTVAGVLLGALMLYSLWAFWPTTGQETGSTVAPLQKPHYFGWRPSPSREFLFFLVVGLAGALGGLIHTVRSFSWYAGNRELRWSWIPFNFLLPLVGALGGTVFYLVFRAGLFSPSTSVKDASPFGFAAVSVLVGLFSEQALEKLRQIAANLFAERPRGADHVDTTESSSSGGSSTGSS